MVYSPVVRVFGPRSFGFAGAAVWLVALCYAAPLLLTRYFPGSDLPWHAAVIEVLGSSDPERAFLGYFEVGSAMSTYVTVYWLCGVLARFIGDTAIAMQVLIAGYVLAFVTGAARLSRAFGGSLVVAVLAAPAVYSMTMGFGFLAYAPTYPMTLWLWAWVRDIAAGVPPRQRSAGLLVGAGVLSALIALTHPFAGVVAMAGVAIILATHWHDEVRGRVLAAAGVSMAGMVPAGLALLSLSRDDSGVVGARTTGLMTQQFVSPVESLITMPERLFGFVGPVWAAVFMVLLLAAAVLARVGWQRAHQAQHGHARKDTVAAPWQRARARCALWLLLALVVMYLITPFTFEWPHYWYGAQPRLLPLIWVVAMVALRPGPDPGPRLWIMPLFVAGLALVVLVAGTFLPFAREAGDFRAVIAHVAPRSRTLGLIEQQRAHDRRVPSPWRNATGYVLAERHGFVSGLPMSTPAASNGGSWVPVRLAAHAPPVPGAPPLGQARRFVWSRHAAGWDFFLIRDLRPGARFDYFRHHAGDVRLVAQSGRWRLYRRL